MQGFLANNDIIMLLPFIVFSMAGLVLLFADLFKENRKVEELLFGLAMIFSGGAGLIYLIDIKGKTLTLFNHGMFVADPIGNFLNLLVIAVLVLTFFVSRDFLSKVNYRHGEYYSLLFFSALGMLLLISANNLLTVFLGLELMSIPLYILSGFLRDDIRSKEAAMKYFILGAFSTGLFAMGVALTYGATGSFMLGKIFAVAAPNQTMLVAGLSLILIGLCFKIALVPFHMWVPDVYEGAPTPIVGFMSVAVKIATFIALVRIFVFGAFDFSFAFVSIMKVMAILSMTLGNLAAIYQKNLKRMLAYSSIAHAGYILIAVISASGEASKVALSALLFYLVAYAMMKMGAFSVIGFFEGKEGRKNRIEDLAEFGFKYPFAALAMSVFMFSLAGIPLTAGFMGKLYIFGAAVKSGYLDLAIIGVINSLISVYYYLRVIVYMYMKKDETNYKPKLGVSTALVIGLAMLLLLFLGIFPSMLTGFTGILSEIVPL